ncbi:MULTISPECIES: sn-glycerol-1-phosphate dehydrogenase [Thermoanaerobacterium]|uniref:3-dehydroquinate synthase n=2 Tax=Thermoanaerobacterium TaxID=28895 RepID=W9E7H4_9THEO|nr:MULTISPECIES: sn-glycerol-1-phosphate dehydrogenase [Thermoanaerobacterium]AFK86299.1 3-dehydroquinate synthase [Thermoanaerobacterium saccharolyticum JW/SL-YS485]ETO37357.1 3-dehydroquinate synthase [Thermoanaerobacterium aotearoense SCUT27]
MNDGTKIKEIEICSGALHDVPNILNKVGINSKVLIVCDKNTYEAAGLTLKNVLEDKKYDVLLCNLNRTGNLVPDERAVGEVLIHLNDGIEALIAVGSGTINDVVKFVSSRAKIPYGIVATAPSMDGYASSVSPLIVNGFKRTYDATYPIFIVGDTKVLKDAPYDMIASGFGDIIGKFTSLADWYVSNIITGEDYSEEIADDVKKSLYKCVDVSKSLKNKDESAVSKLMDALILSGISMLKFGNSRPASGAEHHLSHFIEMKELSNGEIHHSHGAKVGIMTKIAVKLYNTVFSFDRDDIIEMMKERKSESKDEFECRINRNFGKLSSEIFDDIGYYYLDEAERRMRQDRILDNWDTMKEWVSENVPTVEYVDELLNDAGAPNDVAYLELKYDDLKDILLNAKEVRKRYTILRLAEDINIEKIFDMAIKN